MNTEQLLQELSTKIQTGEISREEVVSRLSLVPVAQSVQVEGSHTTSQFSITKIFYVLGAAIVIIGISIFVGQIWEDIGSFARIFVTLGLGLLVAGIGSLLLTQKPQESIGGIFHFIGGILIPGGALVTLSELNSEGEWAVAITFGIICAFYVALNTIHKNAVLTFFAITNASTTAYLVLNAILGGPFDGWFGVRVIYQYLTMAIGISYLLLAYAFRDGWNSKLIGILNFFGITGLLGAAFSQVFDSVLWQMFYFLLVIGGLFLAGYIKSRSVLVMSTVFLLGHVSYITGEYFADSLGWPIVLVVLGFVFIGLGYVSITINKKFIRN